MLYIIIALVIVLLDQLVKYWTVSVIPLGGYMKAIPGLFGFTYVQNTGAAFSLFSEHTWILSLVSVAVSLGIIYVLFFRKLPFWENVGLAMVLGGAVGNAIDRIAMGYVVDMINLELFRFAVFNVADSFIDIGAAVFIILYAVRSIREEKKKSGTMKELDRLRKTAPDLTEQDKPEDDGATLDEDEGATLDGDDGGDFGGDGGDGDGE